MLCNIPTVKKSGCTFRSPPSPPLPIFAGDNNLAGSMKKATPYILPTCLKILSCRVFILTTRKKFISQLQFWYICKNEKKLSLFKSVSWHFTRCVLQSSQDFDSLQKSEDCSRLSGLLLPCPLLLIWDDWKQVTAHLTACILCCSCYAESSICKH